MIVLERIAKEVTIGPIFKVSVFLENSYNIVSVNIDNSDRNNSSNFSNNGECSFFVLFICLAHPFNQWS